MRSQKGFATVLLLTLTPILVALALAVLFSFGFLKSDMAVLNVCRAEQLRIQNKAAKNLTKLLDLNPRAQALRAAHRQAELNLEAAVSSGNPYAIAAAEAYLLRIQMQRQALRVRQQALIQSTNTNFRVGSFQLSQELNREWQQHNSPLTAWLQNRFQISQVKTPELAVKPDFPDVAPVYELAPQFEEAQSWVHSWQISVDGIGWTKSFLHFGGRFQRSCATSLYFENGEWLGKLKKVKFY